MLFAPWGEIILKSVVPMRFSILCLGTGFSNGAIFCHYLAAHRSDVFAAIAPVSGTIAIPFSAWFHPEFPVSLLEIHGYR